MRQKEWKHIVWYHHDVAHIEYVRETLVTPLCIVEDDKEEQVFIYQKWYKERREYCRVAVKYLNGEGFVITSFWSPNLKR